MFFFFFFGLYCNSSFCFRASDSFCFWLLDILRTPALNLCCVIVPLFFFLFDFLNHSFSVVSAGSWYHSSACNHNSLIMFIDFNIKIIKPLAPHPDSCLFNWLIWVCAHKLTGRKYTYIWYTLLDVFRSYQTLWWLHLINSSWVSCDP